MKLVLSSTISLLLLSYINSNRSEDYLEEYDDYDIDTEEDDNDRPKSPILHTFPHLFGRNERKVDPLDPLGLIGKYNQQKWERNVDPLDPLGLIGKYNQRKWERNVDPLDPLGLIGRYSQQKEERSIDPLDPFGLTKRYERQQKRKSDNFDPFGLMNGYNDQQQDKVDPLDPFGLIRRYNDQHHRQVNPYGLCPCSGYRHPQELEVNPLDPFNLLRANNNHQTDLIEMTKKNMAKVKAAQRRLATSNIGGSNGYPPGLSVDPGYAHLMHPHSLLLMLKLAALLQHATPLNPYLYDEHMELPQNNTNQEKDHARIYEYLNDDKQKENPIDIPIELQWKIVSEFLQLLEKR